STTPPASNDARPYHHGDLPRALLEAALQAIAEVGPAAVSLRELARRTGGSHAAPAPHFGDKAGPLTAVAAPRGPPPPPRPPPPGTRPACWPRSPPTGSSAWPPPSARPTRRPGASWRS